MNLSPLQKLTLIRQERNPKHGQGSRLWVFASVIFAIATSLLSAGALYGQNTTDLDSQAGARLEGAKQPPSAIGAWTRPADLCAPDHTCLVGANVAVLHNGNVLFIYYPPAGGNNSSAVLLNTTTHTVTDVSLPFALDVFCSGMAIMPNGQVLVTGGNNEASKSGDSGTVSAVIFNPITNTWSTGQNMNYARWYPSTVELADGTMLELSGNSATGSRQSVMESYAYKTNTWTVLPTSANMPVETQHISAYPRMVVLPSGNVVQAAPDTKTYVFTPSTNTWTYVATNNFGFRFYAPHVLLPGMQKVLVAGGALVEGPRWPGHQHGRDHRFFAQHPVLELHRFHDLRERERKSGTAGGWHGTCVGRRRRRRGFP